MEEVFRNKLDYLLKPPTEDRLTKFWKTETKLEKKKYLYFLVTSVYKIPTKDIIYFEKDKKTSIDSYSWRNLQTLYVNESINEQLDTYFCASLTLLS